MRPLRILIVDDDIVIGALLGELLAELGHDVCATATTETEAVAAAARDAPDLMIIDEDLAAGSGISAMATILQRGPMPHIFMARRSKLTIPAGASILHKPFGTAALVAALDGVAGQFAAPWRAAASIGPKRLR